MNSCMATYGLAAIAREEVLPRFRVEVDAGEAKVGNLGDTAAGGLAVAVERLKEVAEPNAEHRAICRGARFSLTRFPGRDAAGGKAPRAGTGAQRGVGQSPAPRLDLRVDDLIASNER